MLLTNTQTNKQLCFKCQQKHDLLGRGNNNVTPTCSDIRSHLRGRVLIWLNSQIMECPSDRKDIEGYRNAECFTYIEAGQYKRLQNLILSI